MMKNFTRDQLNTINSALADYTRTQSRAAIDLDEKIGRDILTPDGTSLGDCSRREARTANRLRAESAAELHARGYTSCELAHPSVADCPHGR